MDAYKCTVTRIQTYVPTYVRPTVLDPTSGNCYDISLGKDSKSRNVQHRSTSLFCDHLLSFSYKDFVFIFCLSIDLFRASFYVSEVPDRRNFRRAGIFQKIGKSQEIGLESQVFDLFTSCLNVARRFGAISRQMDLTVPRGSRCRARVSPPTAASGE